MGRLRSALDVASQIAFIVACLTLSGFVVYRLTGSGEAAPPGIAAQSDAPYAVGESIVPFEGAPFSASRASIVLIVRSTCVFCTESMDFYRRISSRRAATGVQIIAVAPEPIASLQKYLDNYAFEVDHLSELPKGGYKVSGTPTMILVDRDGRVIKSFQGKLNTEQEDEFLKSLEPKLSASRD
jgi:peroxiredoxin